VHVSRDRIAGMFLGSAIGDALYMPVETWTPKQIADKFYETFYEQKEVQ
jgi:ADP-ribosylglycohydrolase